ncbi:Rho GTPase-activating protein, putative [Entamoeba invadens IP1]|uniref:Rho GTPase-activating protein, putative n=1 Tax=Entamoeba invadens IP1 TaxID=370355 RepID=UPI0002C3D211|nr:Rho GTPase-activating protein, putative [Entamoeba invadens IP1]ELP93008.1 Rho GTPase-activating protein, putative [Entamoeba invadens IP1]|eukprot:XP_004259779.1 Rho GTPase-activating protein, putative [Entamoeba invadens IP1]
MREIKIVTSKSNTLYLIEASSKPRFQIDLSIGIFNSKVNKGTKNITKEKEKLSFEIFYDKVYTFVCPSQSEYDDWMSTLPILMKVYGTYKYPLACAVSKSGWRFPLPIYRAIEYLMNTKGYLTVGIFRTSASYKDTGRVRQIFDGDQDIQTPEFKSSEIAASIIKEYLRELPNPLIPFNFYNDFVVIGRLGGKNKEAEAKKLVERLPEVNQNTLWYLLYLCNEIAQNASENQMNPTNIGTCLGPTVCRAPPQDAMKEMENTKLVIDAFATLVSSYSFIFSNIAQNNVQLGVTPPPYPAVIPHPAAPYEKVTEEIQKEVQERQKRLAAGKPRQSAIFHFGRNPLMESTVDGADVVRKKLEKANAVGQVAEQQNSKPTTNPPRPSFQAPRPPKSPELVDGHRKSWNAKPKEPPASLMHPQQPEQEIIQIPLLRQQDLDKLTNKTDGERPTVPPPRKSKKDEDNETKIAEQEHKIEELQHLVKKLYSRLEVQEQTIQSLVDGINEYYNNYDNTQVQTQ